MHNNTFIVLKSFKILQEPIQVICNKYFDEILDEKASKEIDELWEKSISVFNINDVISIKTITVKQEYILHNVTKNIFAFVLDIVFKKLIEQKYIKEDV